jgi:hypothetical protein
MRKRGNAYEILIEKLQETRPLQNKTWAGEKPNTQIYIRKLGSEDNKLNCFRLDLMVVF